MSAKFNPVRRGPFVLLVIFVLILAPLASSFLGTLASLMSEVQMDARSTTYAVPYWVGLRLGAASGLIAAILWCRFMIQRAIRHGTGHLRSYGALLGMAFGLGAALLLHLSLAVFKGSLQTTALAVGLGLSAPGGLLFGALCGHFCRLAACAARPDIFRDHPPELAGGRSPVRFDPLDHLDVRTKM